jgi:serine/threonine protein kinase
MSTDLSRTALPELTGYEVLEKVAEGGMGTVYKARRRDDGLIVAIKVIASAAARNAILLQRFKREFNVARQIDHPNVVKAIEFCEAAPSPYLVMEFVDGESLGTRIEREGKIPEEEAKRIMVQVCQGLQQAHKQGIIHRDIKPDNILLTRDGVAKITDLGLVKDAEEEMNLTRTGRGLGTPHFMAPEQFRNAKYADARCDIYSLGATLYMMVTGQMPFDGCSPLDAYLKKMNNEYVPPKELIPSLSDRLDWAIRRAMHVDPEMRPATCREFIEDLTGQSIQPQTIQAQPSATDLWYLAYRDEEGTLHTVKGTTPNIRRAYREGLLGDASNIRACRTKQGPFQPLHAIAEFRDLVVDPDATREVRSLSDVSADETTQLPTKGMPSDRSPVGSAGRPTSRVNRRPDSERGRSKPSSSAQQRRTELVLWIGLGVSVLVIIILLVVLLR